MKSDIEQFIKWMFDGNNRNLVKTLPATRIAQLYNRDTNSAITHVFVKYHMNRWILINHEPYDVTKLPSFILNSELFKKYAKSDNVFIETLDGPLWESDKKNN